MELLSAVNDTWLIKATFGALIIFIVKDWLKNSRGKTQCVEQESCPTVHSLHEDQIRFSKDVEGINAKLDKGDEKFDTLQENVGAMSENIAVMTAIMKERHQTGGELFQKGRKDHGVDST